MTSINTLSDLLPYYNSGIELITTTVNNFCDEGGQVARISLAAGCITLLGATYCTVESIMALKNFLTTPQANTNYQSQINNLSKFIIFSTTSLALSIIANGLGNACVSNLTK